MSASCSKPFQITINDSKVLVAYYAMEQIGNVNRLDSTTFANTLKPKGSGMTNAAGVIGQGTLFNAAGNSGLTINAASTSLVFDKVKGITLYGWLRINSYNASPDICFDLFATSGVGASYWEFTINRQNATTVRAQVFGNAFVSQSINLWTDARTSFNFFRVWWDPADGKLRAKINEGATIVSAGAVNAFASIENSATLEMYKTAGGTTFNVDETGIVKGVLSDAQGAYAYNAGAGRTYPDVPPLAGP